MKLQDEGFGDHRNIVYFCRRNKCDLEYLNQFHKEAVERKRKKIAESKQWSMSSEDAVKYMKRNMEMAEKQ